MADARIYEEKVSSKRTEGLFAALAFLFLVLLVLSAKATGFGFMTIVYFCLFCFFTFYSMNYRTLIIRITPTSLELTFGIFKKTVPLDTVEDCHLDDTSMWRIGGAGIHFTLIRKRYRAFYNFLEYPRVVLALRKKGIIRDIAFTTRRPEEVIRIIHEVVSGKG